MEGGIFPDGVPREQMDPIPPWLLQQMARFHGGKPSLIVKEKVLTKTDLTKAQGRLLLPQYQVLSKDFLNGDELTVLDSKPIQGVAAVFLGIDGKRYDLQLRNWATGLVLAVGWKKVIKAKLFKVGDKFPFWCFRLENEGQKLCFALARDRVDVEENWYDDDAILHGPIADDSVNTGAPIPDDDAIPLDRIADDSVITGSPIPDDVKNLAEVETVVSYFSDSDKPGSSLPPTARRFGVLLGSLLSNQTEDQVNTAIRRLHENGLLNPEALDKAEESTIGELIYSVPVPIDTRNETATKMKEIAKTCLLQFNGDIPTSVVELLSSFPVIDRNSADTIWRLAWSVEKPSDSAHAGGSLPPASHPPGSSTDSSHAGGSLTPASHPPGNSTDSSHA